MNMNGLVLHCGNELVTYDDVKNTQTPQPTDTHFPIPHSLLIDNVKQNILDRGFLIEEEAHSLSKEGNRYFGLIRIKNDVEDLDYSTIMGVRNSHDKVFPAGLTIGSRVFVCDNLAFCGEATLSRKHTKNVQRDLIGLVHRCVGKLIDVRSKQDQRLLAYKGTDINDVTANDTIIKAFEANVICCTSIPKVLKQWKNPEHEEFAENKNGWRLFNAFTEVLKVYRPNEVMQRTLPLHGVMDTVCGVNL